MDFFETTSLQIPKIGQNVCGDIIRCEKTAEHTILVICDGLGSGIYANIAAITCADRLLQLAHSGISFKDACISVADSMHKARTEDIPFTAFVAMKVLSDGNFAVYTYEAPPAIIIRDRRAHLLETRCIDAGEEVIYESYGKLFLNDSLLIFSDGISQAGLGYNYPMGLQADGVKKYLNNTMNRHHSWQSVLEDICQKAKEISGGRYEDDTSIAILTAKEVKQLTIATGPPSSPTDDHKFTTRFITMPGKHVICGSTTSDIIARELGEKVEYLKRDISFAAPPEYHINGIDLVTEGALMLSQVNNILDEPMDKLSEQNTVEKLCLLIHEANVITFMHGKSMNSSHTDMIFKQIGIHPRQSTIEQIKEKLEDMGKLVIMENY